MLHNKMLTTRRVLCSGLNTLGRLDFMGTAASPSFLISTVANNFCFLIFVMTQLVPYTTSLLLGALLIQESSIRT